MQVQLGQPRPEYTWSLDPSSGSITVECGLPFPETINFWYAPTIDGNVRRDWRLATCPGGCPDPHKYTLHNVTWFNENECLSTSASATVQTTTALITAPPTGWVAFVVELAWKDQDGGLFTVSTAPSILPMEYPYPQCQGEGCIAGMV
jgi:hypothetical protein